MEGAAWGDEVGGNFYDPILPEKVARSRVNAIVHFEKFLWRGFLLRERGEV